MQVVGELLPSVAADALNNKSPAPQQRGKLGYVCATERHHEHGRPWSDPHEDKTMSARNTNQSGQGASAEQLELGVSPPICPWQSYDDVNNKEGIVQDKLDSAKTKADQLLEREQYRNKTQNKEVGSGGGACYGQRSTSIPVLQGFSGTRIVLSDAIMVANDTPKKDGWVVELHRELRAQDGWP